jgi:hypothetical protein
MSNFEQKPEECDATDDDSSTTAGPIKKPDEINHRACKITMFKFCLMQTGDCFVPRNQLPELHIQQRQYQQCNNNQRHG